ncbi:hypothetical protein L1887_23037 [Cichorium endivia]|nr:hypothetical protein L1887_23037 [Cichorium endivia]
MENMPIPSFKIKLPFSPITRSNESTSCSNGGTNPVSRLITKDFLSLAPPRALSSEDKFRPFSLGEPTLHHINQEEPFAQSSSMIADILVACLTNLPQVIAMKCHVSVIEKRETSVHTAAQLLGETMKIINTLKERHLPNLNPDEWAYIEKWRACLTHPLP